MELIKYLDKNFYSLSELLQINRLEHHRFCAYQSQKLMPKASYVLDLNLSSNSFFGLHSENHRIEYYAKGYSSWLSVIQTLKTEESVYAHFASRYKATISQLKLEGYYSSDIKINAGLDSHIREEWGHFLNGGYGLCTTTGLPEDIAAKELAIIIINELCQNENPSAANRENLSRAVDLLDRVSSEFAPHERVKSSRHKLIDEVRRKYQLAC